LAGLAAKHEPLFRDDGDRCRNHIDDLAGVLVDQFEFATVVPHVVQAENAFGLVDASSPVAAGVVGRCCCCRRCCQLGPIAIVQAAEAKRVPRSTLDSSRLP
jgi:hypothetical protein